MAPGRPRYTMEELLAASDYSQPQPSGEREWVDAPTVGNELPAQSPENDMSCDLKLHLSDEEAWGFAQLVKRLGTRDMGPNGLNLVTREELNGAEDAIIKLREALAEAGVSPR